MTSLANHPITTHTTAPRRRAAVLSVLSGLATAVIWSVVQEPRYRGVVDVQVVSERGSVERIVGEHADRLMSEAVSARWQGPPAAEHWIAARAAGNLTVRLLPERGRLRLSFETPEQGLAERLLPAAVRTYVAYVDTLPLEHFRSPREIEWSERRAALNEELARRRARRHELEASLAETPAASERTAAQAAFDETLDGFERVVEHLRGLRQELVALRSQAPPRGEVSAETYQRGLLEDAVYQQDLKEFTAEARQYRTELAVALTLLADPLEQLRDAVRDFKATMIEQRDLRPPPDVRTLLEQCLAEVGDLEHVVAELAAGWDGRRETVGRLRASEQVVELVGQQAQALEDATGLVADARRVVRGVRTRIVELNAEGDVGTRAIVVVNLLQRGLTGVTERIDLVAEAASQIDPATNFRLDAHDRQLRGLRSRLRDRQERIRQVLQAEADRVARAGRDEQERRLLASIDASDDRRQTLMDALVANLHRIRELDQHHQELREISAELRAEQGAIARLAERLEQLEAERPELRRDVVTLVDSRCEQIAGRHRIRNGALVGVATCAAVGLLCVLMFVRGGPRSTAPLRSRL